MLKITVTIGDIQEIKLPSLQKGQVGSITDEDAGRVIHFIHNPNGTTDLISVNKKDVKHYTKLFHKTNFTHGFKKIYRMLPKEKYEVPFLSKYGKALLHLEAINDKRSEKYRPFEVESINE